MVALIDEDGRLFGLVNVVDLLVVLVVVAMVAAGWALVAGGGPDAGPPADETEESNTTTVVTVEATQLEPYVAEAVPNGTVDGPEVVAVHSKTVEPTTVFVPDQNGQLRVREHPRLKTVTLRVELNTTRSGHGLQFVDVRQTGNGPVVKERPLRVGEEIRLDLDDVAVRGKVTGIDE